PGGQLRRRPDLDLTAHGFLPSAIPAIPGALSAGPAFGVDRARMGGLPFGHRERALAPDPFSQRHLDARGGGGHGASRDPLSRLPRALVLVAASAPGAG